MGAQTDDRLAQYKKRYKDWEDPNGKTFSLRLTHLRALLYIVWVRGAFLNLTGLKVNLPNN